MKAIITLCCEGRQDNGFKFCSGVKNNILDLDTITHKENYMDLIKYLDKVAGVFDKPSCQSHIITNTIYKIFEMDFVNEEFYMRLSDFYKFHNRCGLILMIETK